mgnify:CR=1 FL=1
MWALECWNRFCRMFIFYQCGEKVLLGYVKYMNRKSFKEIDIKQDMDIGISGGNVCVDGRCGAVAFSGSEEG